MEVDLRNSNVANIKGRKGFSPSKKWSLKGIVFCFGGGGLILGEGEFQLLAKVLLFSNSNFF